MASGALGNSHIFPRFARSLLHLLLVSQGVRVSSSVDFSGEDND
jgi:hypothetical protein